MKQVHVLIIGAGTGGTGLLEMFQEVKSIHIIGVVDKNADAPGLKLARRLNIPTASSWQQFCHSSPVDIILNVTGDRALREELKLCSPEKTEIIDGKSTHFIWMLINEFREKKIYQQKYLKIKRELDRQATVDFIIGKSPKILEVKELVERVAPTTTTVLIRGETGTGKEMFARAIHRASNLKDRPFIIVNCTALTSTLMESELFGYKKGAFTGADQDRKGLLEEADGGTVFLDEIGDMNLELQAKLLRFLQTGEIRPVGSTQTKIVNVRIIAATNRKLEEAIQQGLFRQDLFYRFNTFTITLPPLRDRISDIPYLAYHFLTKAEAKVNKRVGSISNDALHFLAQYNWPGNVRELENVIERALILCQGEEILPQHLPIQIIGDGNIAEGETDFRTKKDKIVESFEKLSLLNYIQQAEGNISKAARLAGIPRRTFYRMLKKHQIEY